MDPGVITSSVISACEKGKTPANALKLFEGMQQKGLELDIIPCAAISACSKVKQTDKALELLGGMQQKGLNPGLITYIAAICACEKGK